MSKDLIEIKKMGGIKCDNPNCDFKDESVSVKDYKKWLNKPCPVCGSNLLTKKDYKSFKRLLSIIKIMNKVGKILPTSKTAQQREIIHVNWDGSGKTSFNVETNNK